jgi:serine phosphatase RsbU (regulator of sigma subunit)
LQNLARAAVPGLADMCLVDMIEDGRLVRAAAVHADPAKEELVRKLQEGYPPYDPEGIHPVTRAIQTGVPAFSPEISDDFIRRVTQEGEHRDLVHSIGFRSYLCVPLVTGGKTLGAISFISTTPGRRYTQAEVPLAEDLGRRAALGLENARLFRERSHIARTLQRSLLPNRLPHVPGVQLAGRYRAAGEGAEVGGDFYDVFDAGDRGWGLVIGDVCGKGPDAAAVTGLARYTIRAAAMQESRPSKILSLLNEAVMQQVAEQGFCTVCYVRLRRAQAGNRITVCCAGHPLPLLLRADGTVDFVGTPGTLLGIFPDPELSDVALDMAPGDALVLYTDGVIEERGATDLFGTERLVDVVRSCVGLDAEGIAAAIEHAVNEFLPGDPRDDIAILVLRMRP